MPHRLPPTAGESLDRSRPVTIYFQDKPIQAFTGETVASALMAGGVEVFSRSFKYHRPRGPFCLSGQCGRCAMTVNGRPQVRTCQTKVAEGMRVEPQGKLGTDPLALADGLSPLMPTGFYYKSFYKSPWVWRQAIKGLRRSAGGSAKVAEISGHPRHEAIHLTPELLVVGGGLAGLEAARAGTRAGVRVVLVESSPRLGGFAALQGAAGQEAAQKLIDELSGQDNLTILLNTTVNALYPDGLFLAEETVHTGAESFDRVYVIRPGASVLATGALSRPLVFPHNDRPGVFLPEAAQKMAHWFGLAPGSKVFLAGGSDHLYAVALEMAARGITLAGLADFRQQGLDESLLMTLAQKGVPIFAGHAPSGVAYGKHLEGVELVKLDTGNRHSVPTNALVLSGGRTPRHQLLRLAGARVEYDPGLNLHLPAEMPPGYFAAGRVLGLCDQEAIQAQGALAGAQALAYLGLDAGAAEAQAKEALAQAPPLKPVAQAPAMEQDRGKTFVCFCHDVTLKDVETALAEGYDNVESAKRYTTATMGACQGGTCQANFASMLADKGPKPLATQGLTTPRAFAAPISLGALASSHHRGVKLPPLHQVQVAAGGRAARMGIWMRVEDFGQPRVESLAVRQAAGLVDVSTLGKFRVFGPDAARLLNRIYLRPVDGLEPGSILYNLGCNEEGVPIDDGAITIQGENDYLLTTSTARAPATRAWFGRYCREENWRTWVADLTDAYAGMNLAGPHSRKILAGITDADISNQALPFMHWAWLELAGVRCLILRMGFLGELSYEIHCPSGQGGYLWSRIMEVGQELGLKAGGLETQYVCRLEKGHALPGLDIDGNTNLFEAGLGWLWSPERVGAVGGPMLKLLVDEPMKQKVLAFSHPGLAQIKEGYIVLEGNSRLGYVTSCRYSHTLDATIGLALAEAKPEFAPGGKFILAGEGVETEASIVKPPFYDPHGERLRS